MYIIYHYVSLNLNFMNKGIILLGVNVILLTIGYFFSVRATYVNKNGPIIVSNPKVWYQTSGPSQTCKIILGSCLNGFTTGSFLGNVTFVTVNGSAIAKTDLYEDSQCLTSLPSTRHFAIK